MRAIIAFPLRSCGLSFLLALAACGGGGGGGGGGPSGPTFVGLSPGTLNFSAASPSAATPTSQTLTATITGVTSGTLYIKVAIDGVIVTSVTNINIISATQGQATINPGTPGSLGTGTHNSTITVSVCTTDANCSGPQLAGSPKTVNVSYTVGSSVQADAVAPYIGTTNVPGDLIIRGHGFTPTTSVSFGANAATAFSVVSDTEIHANYPALTANIYPVSLNGGAIPFSESLKIVDAPAYVSATLSYPSAPQLVRGLVYDAERAALLVALSFPITSNNQLLRYAYSSGWPATPDSLAFAELRDIALSVNGSKLLAISSASMTELNPATLGTITAPVAKPDPFTFGANEFMRGVAVANDGNTFVTTGYNGSGSTGLYLYSASKSAFSTTSLAGSPFKFYSYAVAGASGNGATVMIMESGISPAQPVDRYTASTGILAATNLPLAQSSPYLSENINAPAFDRVGSRMIVPNSVGFGSPYSVYDANLNALGQLPSTTAGYAVSPGGTRAYTVEIASPCQVRAFDLVSTTGAGNLLNEITTGGYPITLASCPGNTAFPQSIKMLVNPAGDTLFIAGNLLINVVPLP